MLSVASSIKPGNPVIPVGVPVPVDKLAPGAYRLVLQAKDSAGHDSVVRTVDLDVE
jgi:hypothetical protein